MPFDNGGGSYRDSIGNFGSSTSMSSNGSRSHSMVHSTVRRAIKELVERQRRRQQEQSSDTNNNEEDSLTLSHLPLTRYDIEFILDFLEQHPHVTLLGLMHCNLRRCGALHDLFVDFFQHNETVHTVDFSHNWFGSDATVTLLPAFYHNSAIRELYLARMGFAGILSGEYLRRLLVTNHHIRKLDLSENPQLGLDGIRELARGIIGNHAHGGSLRELSLHGCHFGDKACCVLVESLATNPTGIKTLDLSGNDLGPATLNAFTGLLMQELSHNTKVESFILDSNPMLFQSRHPSHYALFAHALKDNGSMKKLSLMNCGVNESVECLMYSALEENDVLETLDMQHNTTGTLAYCQLVASLPKFKGLRELTATTTTITWGSAAERHSLLSTAPSRPDNALSLSPAQSLLYALESNHKLEHLSVSPDESWTLDMWAKIDHVLRRNRMWNQAKSLLNICEDNKQEESAPATAAVAQASYCAPLRHTVTQGTPNLGNNSNSSSTVLSPGVWSKAVATLAQDEAGATAVYQILRKHLPKATTSATSSSSSTLSPKLPAAPTTPRPDPAKVDVDTSPSLPAATIVSPVVNRRRVRFDNQDEEQQQPQGGGGGGDGGGFSNKRRRITMCYV